MNVSFDVFVAYAITLILILSFLLMLYCCCLSFIEQLHLCCLTRVFGKRGRPPYAQAQIVPVAIVIEPGDVPHATSDIIYVQNAHIV